MIYSLFHPLQLSGMKEIPLLMDMAKKSSHSLPSAPSQGYDSSRIGTAHQHFSSSPALSCIAKAKSLVSTAKRLGAPFLHPVPTYGLEAPSQIKRAKNTGVPIDILPDY